MVKHSMNIRILQTMISGIHLLVGLGTMMSDPYVYVVFLGSMFFNKVWRTFFLKVWL